MAVIRVLGPFELVHDGQVVPVGGPVGQAILTALACRPDTKVLPAQLITMVWGEPDAASPDTLYHHVARLRGVLAPVGLAIVGHRPGYRLPVTADQVDVARFHESLRASRALSATDPDAAADGLRSALALWRSAAAVDNLTLPGIRRLAAGWEARRLDAEEDLAEFDLLRGHPDQVLDRLHTLVADHPHRPRLAGALVRALAATGRTEQATDVLAEADRSAGSAHPALVQARQALSCPPAKRHDPAAVVPFQLPADTVRFTGRGEHLAHLLDLDRSPDGPATVVVSGLAGIGKTALAVHAAHRMAARFPDGVLFSDLRGFTAQTEPTAPEHALDYLLRGLGVPGPRIPPDLDARVGVYRSVLAGRRVLVVLDNAADETQVQPLLPATAGCAVIVTSRRHLAGLDDATHLTLSVLEPAEAAALFRGLAGDRVTPADRPVVDRIVALCGRLPLAIRIAAARLRQAPAGSVTALCTELADALGAGRGLDWLSDGHRAVTTALAVSFRHLTASRQHALRLIGLHPGPVVEPGALAALAETTVDGAMRLLDDLHAASLLNQPAHRRYTRHDLVATYATTLAADLPEPDRRTALDRLYDHYAATSSRAVDLTRPWETDQRPHPPATPTTTLPDREHAQSWLDNETENLLATAHHAAGNDRADHTLHQSATLRRHLRAGGHFSRAAQLHQRALDSARRIGDHAAEQDALNGLGSVHRLQGRYGPAAECFEKVLAITGHAGDQAAESEALHGLGYVHYAHGRYESAADCLARALAVARRTGSRSAEQEALNGLGYINYAHGRYEPAMDYLTRALAGARRSGNRTAEQDALRGLGYLHYVQGRHEPATEHFEQALAIARQTGNHTAEQNALVGLGRIYHAHGRYEQAADCLARLLSTARRTGDRNAQFEAHHVLGRIHHATGHHHDALHHHETALQLAIGLDQPTDQTRAHDGLAHAHRALNQPRQARDHWQAALALLTGIGADQTEEPDVTATAIRAHLDDPGLA